jgi:hypothetical protein
VFHLVLLKPIEKAVTSRIDGRGGKIHSFGDVFFRNIILGGSGICSTEAFSSPHDENIALVAGN